MTVPHMALANVRFLPLADVPILLTNVRFRALPDCVHGTCLAALAAVLGNGGSDEADGHAERLLCQYRRGRRATTTAAKRDVKALC